MNNSDRPGEEPNFGVLFPAFCHGLREPDPEYQREVQALEDLGVPWHVVNLDALQNGDFPKAFKFVGDATGRLLIYRGWILHPEEYAQMNTAVEARGGRLLTTPSAYRKALLFPEYFPAIAEYSFPAVWIAGSDARCAKIAARRLGPPPYFIKDYVKSAKEMWPEGCVVSSEQEMAPAIRALRKFRGERFEGGIVIRPLIPLRCLGEHPFGGKINEEYRLIFFLGLLISQTPYDRQGGDASSVPDYRCLGQCIESPFFTADVVVTENGRHFVLEAGDGGSSALPPNVSPDVFYAKVLEVFRARPVFFTE